MPTLTRLLERASSGATLPRGPVDDTDRAILDAVVLEVAAQGVDGFSAEGVARRAGVGRATIYRRFGDRETLLASMVWREGRRLAARIAATMESLDDPAEQFVEGWVTAVHGARTHPIVARLALLEPEQLVALWAADGAGLLRFAAAFCEQALGVAAAAGATVPGGPAAAGEVLARLMASQLLLPATDAVDPTDPDSLRAHARVALVPLFLGVA